MQVFLLFLLSMIVMHPAFAQNVYVPPRNAPIAPSAPVTPQDELNELLGQERIVQEPQTIGDYTYLHYKQCIATEHPILEGRDLKRMCSCTAANFKESMSVENIREIENNTAEGVMQQNRLLYFVYAPCVKPTLHRMLVAPCVNNKKNKLLMKNPGATCSCIGKYVSERIGDYVVPKLIEGSLSMPQQEFKPLHFVVDEDVFDRNLRHYSNFCLRNLER